MNYQRIILRSALCLKNLFYCLAGQRVCGKSVHGFGGYCHDTAVSEYLACEKCRLIYIAVICFNKFSLHYYLPYPKKIKML